MNFKSTLVYTIAALSIGYSEMRGQSAYAKNSKSLDTKLESVNTQFDADYSAKVFPIIKLNASMDKKRTSRYKSEYVMNGSAEVSIPGAHFNVGFRTYLQIKDSMYVPTHFFMFELDGNNTILTKKELTDIVKEFGPADHFTDYKHLIFDKENNIIHDVVSDSTNSIDSNTVDVLSAYLNVARNPKPQQLKLYFFDGPVTADIAIGKEEYEGVMYTRIGADLTRSHAHMKITNFLRLFDQIYVLVLQEKIPVWIVGDTPAGPLRVKRDTN